MLAWKTVRKNDDDDDDSYIQTSEHGVPVMWITIIACLSLEFANMIFESMLTQESKMI